MACLMQRSPSKPSGIISSAQIYFGNHLGGLCCLGLQLTRECTTDTCRMWDTRMLSCGS